jgi:hypothetical protein
MFGLTKWAVAAALLNVLVALSFFSGGASPPTIFWFGTSLAILAYTIWLRRKRILT